MLSVQQPLQLSIQKKTKKVEDPYLKHTAKHPNEIPPKLSEWLSDLEHNLGRRHTKEQFYSFRLFLKLCYKYRGNLPNDYTQYGQPDKLIPLLNDLRNSKFFNNTSEGDVLFVERALKVLSSEEGTSNSVYNSSLVAFPPPQENAPNRSSRPSPGTEPPAPQT